MCPGDTRQLEDWWWSVENCVKTSVSPPIFPSTPLRSSENLRSPAVCEPLGENQLFILSVFLPHTHVHTQTSFCVFHTLRMPHIYLHFSLLCCSLFTSVSPYLLALVPLRSHMYIRAYLLTTVFPCWSPFENHLIRKACEAHTSSATHTSCCRLFASLYGFF